MGRRESIPPPSVAGPAGARLAKQEFATIQVQVRSLLQEAKVLREEAMALHEASHHFGDRLHRRSLLHRQALLCATEAMELIRLFCLRPDRYWARELDSGLVYGC